MRATTDSPSPLPPSQTPVQRRGSGWSSVALGPLILVIVLGLFLGIPVAELTGYLPSPWFQLGQIATPWMLASFGCGCVCRRPLGGALAGVAVLVAGVSPQIVYKTVVYGGFSVRPLLEVIGYWGILAAFLGPIMGLAGALSRSDHVWIRAYSRSVPAAITAVEALVSGIGWRTYGWSITLLIALLAGVLFSIAVVRSDFGRVAVATSILVTLGLVVVLALQDVVPII